MEMIRYYYTTTYCTRDHITIDYDMFRRNQM